MGAQLNQRTGHSNRIAETGAIRQETADDTVAVVLSPEDGAVNVTIPASGTKAVTLPPASKCAGKTILIFMGADLGGTAVTVDDGAEGVINIGAARSMASLGNFVLAYCPAGLGWTVIDQQLS